jgi:hypothetical protein
MKSLLFKSAWAIFKMENVSFSEALKLAWEHLKSGLKANIVKFNTLVKSKGLGYETVFYDKLMITDIETQSSIYDNEIAYKSMHKTKYF